MAVATPEPGASFEVGTEFARAAANNPAVQQALRSQAQAAGQAAANTYCQSFVVYTHRLRAMPQLRPFRELVKCRMENVEDWFPHFGRWNVLWVQANMLAFTLHVVILLVMVLFSLGLAILTAVFSLFFSALRMSFVVLVGHAGHYFVVEHGGCCGSCGFVIFWLFYVGLAVSSLSGLASGASHGVGSFIYLIIFLPTFYMCLALWKIGAGGAIKDGSRRAWAAGKAAMQDPAVTRAPGAAPFDPSGQP